MDEICEVVGLLVCLAFPVALVAARRAGAGEARAVAWGDPSRAGDARGVNGQKRFLLLMAAVDCGVFIEWVGVLFKSGALVSTGFGLGFFFWARGALALRVLRDGSVGPGSTDPETGNDPVRCYVNRGLVLLVTLFGRIALYG